MAPALSAAVCGELDLLAGANDPQSRARLLDRMVELCRDGGLDPRTRETMGRLFAALARRAEHDIRLTLAHRLAGAGWAPPEVVRLLSSDDIEIAAPVISDSPVLTDADLLALLRLPSLDHRIAVAGRPALSEPLTDFILDQNEGQVLAALAGNQTAQLSPGGMQRLVEAARKVVSLRNRLARHPRLTPDLAARLYESVGAGLQSGLMERFDLDPEQLAQAMAKAVKEAAGRGLAVEDADSVEHLVDKLHLSGRLGPATLLRALRERRLGFFRQALAKLAGMEAAAVERATNADTPEVLALCCAGAGLDQGVFNPILEALRELNGGLPGGGAEGARRAQGAFAPFPARVAAGAARRFSLV